MTRLSLDSRRAALALCAIGAAVSLSAACGSKPAATHNPLPVYDDVYLTGQANNRILLDGDTAWIVNSGDNTVDAVDLTSCGTTKNSCQRVRQAHLPNGSSPYDEALAQGSLWVTGLFSNALYRVDPASAAVTATITSGAGGFFNTPESIAFASGKLFVSNADYGASGLDAGFVSVVDGSSITAQIATTQKDPVGFAAWPGNLLAVTNNGVADFSTGVGVATTAGGIDLIDTGADSIASNIDLGLTLPGPLVALSTDGKYAFTGSGNGAKLLRVNVATGAVDATTFSTTPTFSSDVLVDGTTVYLLSFNEDRVYAVDVNTLQPVFLNTAGQPTSFVSVGPGGSTPKGPNYATVWHHAGEKHLLVLMTLANSMTDVILP